VLGLALDSQREKGYGKKPHYAAFPAQGEWSTLWLMRDTDSMKQIDLASIFRDYEKDLSARDHLPAAVLENRRRRAQTRIRDALASRGSGTVPPELRREVQQLVRRWARQSFADGFKEIEEFEIRCAREHDLVAAQASGNSEEILKALEVDYRRRVIDQYGRLELRGVQTSERVYFELNKVFVPLYLAETSPHLDELQQQDIAEPALQVLARRIARVPVLDVLRRHRHLLIVGAPGSGKTTLVAYLAARAAEGRLFEGDDTRRDILPFVLTVRTFTKGEITAESVARLTDCDERLVQHALETDRTMLFIDGIDEVPRDMGPQILQSLVQLRAAYPKASVVVTSRPTGIARDHGKALPDYMLVDLLTMTRDDVESFIDKWCLAAELSVSSDVQTAERRAQEGALDLKQRLEGSRPIQRLVETPLLATILCVVHRFLGHRIPEHRVTLYEKCTDALLYEWDRSKFGNAALVGKLDALAKRKLLSGLARRMHDRKQAEVPAVEVLRHFKQALPDLGQEASGATQIIEEIRDRSGVLVERRPGFFAFSHMMFQEYLTALTFVPQTYKELVNHYEDSWWHEVIVLGAGIPGADAGRLARELLKKRGPAAILLAAQCLETAVEMPLKVREEIERRLATLIPPKTDDDTKKLGLLGTIAAPALTKALDEELEPDEVQRILTVLLLSDYEPAISAIARFATDSDRGDSMVAHQAFAMLILALKARSSRLAKATFLASVPKLSPMQATLLATMLAAGASGKNSERAVFQELLATLPDEAKKGLRRRKTAARAAADSDRGPANRGS
jgi:NACHT domain